MTKFGGQERCLARAVAEARRDKILVTHRLVGRLVQGKARKGHDYILVMLGGPSRAVLGATFGRFFVPKQGAHAAPRA